MDASTPERVALGLSGGADSVALFYRTLSARQPFVALHLNHAFADENGDEAESFVRALCTRHAVPLEVGRIAEPQPPRETKEVFARRHRLAFFAERMRALGIRTLLLAHQADDRAENLILRLARGCGLEGLLSFGAEAPFPGAPDLRIVRPLLALSHAELVAELRTASHTWIEDISNQDTRIPRNAIRNCLLPLLPHFTAGANASADLLAEENAFLEQLTSQSLDSLSEERLTLHAETPAVLIRRALRRWLGTALSRAQAQRLLTLPVGEVCQIAGARSVRRESETAWVRLPDVENLAPPPPLTLDRPGTYRFGAWSLNVEAVTEAPRAPSAPPFETFVLPAPLVVRTREPGDRLSPPDLKGRHKKVQDLFIEMRVPAPKRASYPLLCTPKGEVLAMPGFRPSAVRYLPGAPLLRVYIKEG